MKFKFFQSELSNEQIIELADTAKVNALKEKLGVDKVNLCAYVLATTGFSYPTIEGEGVTELEWTPTSVRDVTRKTIEAIKSKEVYAFSSHTEREKVGEVVGAMDYIFNGKISSLVVVAMYDERRADAISMEADIKFDKNKVLGVNSIDAVAVTDSRIMEPAIKGAYQIAKIAANEPINLSIVGFQDLVNELKKRKVYPSQLFSEEEIFGRIEKLEDGTIQVIGGDREFIKTQRKKEEEFKASYEKKIKELEENALKLAQDSSKLKAIETLPKIKDAVLKEIKDENFKKYVDKTIGDITIDSSLEFEGQVKEAEKSLKAGYEKIKDLIGEKEQEALPEPLKEPSSTSNPLLGDVI